MRRTALAALLLAAAAPLPAQTREDSAAIRATALDYIQGFFTANPERMARSLHPELIKRIIYNDTLGGPFVSSMGATELVRNTRRGGGPQIPAAQRRDDVTILDIFQNTASVKVDAGLWVDYLHIVRFQGRWVILNVLWELRRR